MGRRMHLWCHGHFGPPLLVFPSASGMAHEWEAHGMVEALGDLIGAGRLKLYCTESNVSEAWTRRERHPAERIGLHRRFEQYVVEELVPHIRADCRSDSIPIGVSGTSLGALYSANFALKWPATFRFALCMSGRYDVSWLTDGFVNEDIYYANPLAYLPGLEGERLQAVRDNARLVVVCGQGKWEDGNVEDTIRFCNLLQQKEIPHQRELWGHDVSHEWPWWRRQARLYLGQSFC